MASMVEEIHIYKTGRRAHVDQAEDYGLPKKMLDCRSAGCRLLGRPRKR